ncbi:Cucumisin [Vitis vinifera]|uniref:Cucumisin n=1 Tax=Vitis vinifera TaxID=29760 RepID=A0A438ILD8_VITVI|nr:Cucumisin [Vitis vinifera]
MASLITLTCSTLLISCSTASEEDREADDPSLFLALSISCTWVIFQRAVLSPYRLSTLTCCKKSSAVVVHPNIYSAATRGASNGFVAELTKEEMKRLSAMKGVVSVFPNEKKQLLTTRSWDFMGFPQKVTRNTTESDIVVGMLDSGIWPESASFSDKGFGPPPSKWKGTCETSTNFTCNNGSVPEGEFESARDANGHGTHTASTAAGGIVDDASLLGVASGTARGGVPSARIAVYKICWSDGCFSADILAAFDDAIADGNGILTSNSAGNSGPDLASITNFSPWSLSVAASTIDRKFLTKLVLGDNQDSISLNTFKMKDMHPIIYAGDAPNRAGGFTGSESRLCTDDSLDKSLVTGKIVFCDGSSRGQAVLAAGAAGTIIPDEGNEGELFLFLNATAKIERSIAVKEESAPIVASFSSRGPNPVTTDILSPDITAPGVQILAAWTEASPLTDVPGDKRVAKYNIISGTSMSCPHASGAAAYVKSFHPTWSPAAIKSALMTTATPMNVKTNTDLEFAYGAGHLNPVKARNPGLVSCTKATNGTVWDLNYPSFTLTTRDGKTVTRTFARTVTNVGSAVSTYKVKVTASPGLTVKVEPSVLTFKSLGQKKTFTVTATAAGDELKLTGSLVWDDGVFQ